MYILRNELLLSGQTIFRSGIKIISLSVQDSNQFALVFLILARIYPLATFQRPEVIATAESSWILICWIYFWTSITELKLDTYIMIVTW